MIVNTARAASRAFYLNIKKQPDVVTCSRYHFDRIASRYVSRNRATRLKELARSWRRMQDRSDKKLHFGIVYHAVRFNLAFPYEDPRNLKFLNDVRDLLGVDHIFFVVRRPEEIFLSELNRLVALKLGDWTFLPNGKAWPNEVRMGELENQTPPTPTMGASLPAYDEKELIDLSAKLSIDTGKVLSMYRQFDAAFPNVHLISYEKFMGQPKATFEYIADTVGFQYQDSSLAEVKLNSLSNRLMIYNPTTLSLPTTGQSGVRRFLGNVFGGQGRNTLKLRFELEPLIDICDDWGTYTSIGVDMSEKLPNVFEDFGVPIGIGASTAQYARLSTSMKETLRCPTFLDDLTGYLAPVFDENYVHTKALYRANYLKKSPPELFKIFWQENAAEFDGIDEIARRLQPDFW